MKTVKKSVICTLLTAIFVLIILAAPASAYNLAEMFPEPEPVYFENLENITLYAMGDSYFGGSKLGKELTWVNQMGKKYNMSFINYGIGGSTVSDFVTDKHPMVDRYTDMEDGNPDVILIEGGRNDRNFGVPLGKNKSRDSKTFLGALNIMIDGCLEKYPNAVIILVTPWYNTAETSDGYTNVTYADAMRDLVNYKKNPRVFCLYAADKDASGVNMDDSDFRTYNCIGSSDVSHLNEIGMRRVQPFMETQISACLDSYKEYLENPPTGCGSLIAPSAGIFLLSACCFIIRKKSL